ncbi:MAG: ABC transporter permease subunit, partial [Reinekea sp.]|nr:ABC transporter permease subunit [Reinekea sp.]
MKHRLAALPWWLLTAALLALLFLWQLIANEGYQSILTALVKGLGVTLYVSLLAFALATTLGLVFALMRVSKQRWLREIATFYIEIIRGVPMLVLLFYIAFVGAPALVGVANWLFALPIQWE